MEEYPRASREQGIALGMGGPEPIVAPQATAWQFGSDDGKWTASLTSNFFALKTSDYLDFERFIERFNRLKAAFEAVYKPRSYTRIGLRYVNRLTAKRSEPDQPVDWSRWLHSCIAGEYADSVLAP